MAHFSIFVPNTRRNLPAPLLLSGLGLEGLARAGDRQPDLAEIREGSPDGACGLLVSWGPTRHADLLAYNPAAPDPARGLASGRFWFGFDPRSTVHPAELQRDDAAFDGGNAVTLADGRQWTVPFLHGVLFRAGVSRFECESIRAAHHVKALADSRWPEPWDLAETKAAVDVCADLLAFNYRINRELCYILGLFDVPTLQAILDATCRAPQIPSQCA